MYVSSSNFSSTETVPSKCLTDPDKLIHSFRSLARPSQNWSIKIKLFWPRSLTYIWNSAVFSHTLCLLWYSLWIFWFTTLGSSGRIIKGGSKSLYNNYGIIVIYERNCPFGKFIWQKSKKKKATWVLSVGNSADLPVIYSSYWMMNDLNLSWISLHFPDNDPRKWNDMGRRTGTAEGATCRHSEL